jgi:ankyrin repeat protein
MSLTSYDTAFTGLAADGGCGAGQVCDQGACASGCYIDNAFVAPNTANGSDSCESCGPGDVSNWTNAMDGTACTGNGGYYCQNGQCENVCDIAGQLLSNGSSDPANTCQSCQTANDPTNWSPVTVGAVTCSSNGGNYCVEGSCALACDISGAVLDAGALDTTNGCQSCQPSLAATAFSPVADGTTCSTGGTYCVGGSCAKDCEIGGVLLADGTIDGGNPNVCCNVGVSSTGWTAGFAAASASPSTGTSPEGIAIGDLNGDGKQDLAVANYLDATVGILLGQGNGAFAAQKTVSVGSGPQAVALADFNGDTFIDIAVANNGAATVSVLLQQGDGGFEPAPGSPDAIGGKATAIGVGHFGSLTSEDIVVTDLGVNGPSGNEISVLLNSGTGTFGASHEFSVGTKPSSLAVADFNQDGFDDVAVANSTDGTVTVLLNNGNGTFSPQATLSVGSGTSPAGIVALSLNGGAEPDLAVSCNGTNDVRTFMNLDGGWSAMQGPFAVGTAPLGIASGDFDGDSIPDLAVVNNDNSGTVSVLINQTAAGAPTATFATQATYQVGSDPVGIAVALFTPGAPPDLAITNNNGNTLSVLLGQCP